jgi:hypothetical protein
MSYHQIYTFGYANFTVAQLKAKAAELNASVIDTRYRAASRLPEWNKNALDAALRPVPYYAFGAYFGNVNYKNGLPIQLANPEGIKDSTIDLLVAGPIILVCQCWSFATCHRSEVARLIQGWTGSEIFHLIGKDLPKKIKNGPTDGGSDLSQGSLF